MQVKELELFDFQKLSFNEIQRVENTFLENELKQVSLEDIKQLLLSFKSMEKDDYLQLGAFKDGHSQIFDRAELLKTLESEGFNSLKKFPFSLRVTNIQKSIPQVKKVVVELFKSFQLPVTCNLYLTPRSEANCFAYHSDYQETIVFQVCGEKEWSFPVEDGALACKPYFAGQGFSPKQVKKLNIKKSDLISIGHSVLHKAEHKGDDISVHLTFAIHRKNRLDFVKNIMGDLFLSQISAENLQEVMQSKEELSSFLQTMRESLESLDSEKYIKDYIEKNKLSEMSFLKNGRKY